MLKNTFTFIPGIGKKTEESFWGKGIFTWDDFTDFNRNGLDRTKKKIINDYIKTAKDAINSKNISFFAKHLPQKEHWKLYKEFYDKTVFLDIETTGLSLYYDVITLIGTFDGKEVRLFVKDNNLSDIIKHLNNYDILITFNGSKFDVPFIKNEFPNIKIPPVHIDLRYTLKSLGITGPLKKIEKKLGIIRKSNIQKIDGREATVLWSRFIKGDDESLNNLILYNIYDTTDLQTLMDYCYKEKIKQDVLPVFKRDSNQPRLFKLNRSHSIDHSLPKSNFTIPAITIRRSNGSLSIKNGRKTLLKIDRKRIKKPEIKLDQLISKIRRNGYEPVAVGIDLTGSETRPTGFCILDGKKAYLCMVNTDEELIAKTIDANPAIVSIDSPLSLPIGRDCADDSCECRKYGIMRECERILKRRGINVYPSLIQSMQKLTLRGIGLAKTLEDKNLGVIESYPGAAQDILGFPRKRIDLKELEIDLMNMGIKPFSDKEMITHDELDALTSAIVGYFYLAEMYEAIGNLEEKYLIVPELTGMK